MKMQELKNNLYWVGVKDADLRVFDIIMNTKYGTTYNSYLIKDEKNILIDTAKESFYEEYISNIKNVLGDEKIDYIISNHTEPDHSGSIKKLLSIYPDAQVICSKPAAMYLRAMLNSDFNCKTVTDGEELKLGSKKFRFISAPFLHWPDTMFTYDIDEKVLFSGDVLGCHYCPSDDMILNSEPDGYLDAFEYYFNVIMGPFKNHVIKAMNKIKDVDIKMVCASHGPVLVNTINSCVDKYINWSKKAVESNNEKNILIAYVSAYGYTRSIAEQLYKTLSKYGDFCVELVNISDYEISEIKNKIESAEGMLIGSPTFNQDALKPVWDVLSVVCPINVRGVKASAFGSYGWSGEAVKMLEDRLKSLKFKVIESGLRFNFTPSEEDLEATEQFAHKFIESLKS